MRQLLSLHRLSVKYMQYACTKICSEAITLLLGTKLVLQFSTFDLKVCKMIWDKNNATFVL